MWVWGGREMQGCEKGSRVGGGGGGGGGGGLRSVCTGGEEGGLG